METETDKVVVTMTVVQTETTEITGSRAIRVADPMTAETTEETIATTGITETETTAEEMKDLPFLHRLYRNRSRVVTRQRIKKKITSCLLYTSASCCIVCYTEKVCVKYNEIVRKQA